MKKILIITLLNLLLINGYCSKQYSDTNIAKAFIGSGSRITEIDINSSTTIAPITYRLSSVVIQDGGTNYAVVYPPTMVGRFFDISLTNGTLPLNFATNAVIRVYLSLGKFDTGSGYYTNCGVVTNAVIFNNGNYTVPPSTNLTVPPYYTHGSNGVLNLTFTNCPISDLLGSRLTHLFENSYYVTTNSPTTLNVSNWLMLPNFPSAGVTSSIPLCQ